MGSEPADPVVTPVPANNSDRANGKRALAVRTEVAEEQRDLAKQQREVAEEQREAAEEQRDKAEDVRLADEILRRVAEKTRDAAEQLRRNAEHARQTAEDTRNMGFSALRAPEQSPVSAALRVATTDQQKVSDDLGTTAEKAQAPSVDKKGGS